MSRKRDQESLRRINAAYDALFNDLVDVPLEEVHRALDAAGIDRDALRRSLHERATQLARRLRASGQGAPPALVGLLEQTAGNAELPRDPRRALDKATRYLADLLSPVQPRGLEVVAAFRGEGDLSDRDRRTIANLEAELEARAEAKGGEPED